MYTKQTHLLAIRQGPFQLRADVIKTGKNFLTFRLMSEWVTDILI